MCQSNLFSDYTDTAEATQYTLPLMAPVTPGPETSEDQQRNEIINTVQRTPVEEILLQRTSNLKLVHRKQEKMWEKEKGNRTKEMKEFLKEKLAESRYSPTLKTFLINAALEILRANNSCEERL